MDRDNRLPDEDRSLGEPVSELKLLREEPDPNLLQRIRGSINRRSLVADGLDLSFLVLFEAFFEYLKTTIQSLAGEKDGRKEP
jgi:hypothetical protein